MDRAEAEAKYRGIGLVTRYIEDSPLEVYEPHEHEGVYLFTLDGSAKLRLDNGEWQAIEAGQETRIGDNQRHEAVVGKDGWKYIFAASAQEMERQGL